MPANVLIIADRQEIATLIAHCLVSTGMRPLIANDIRHAGLLLQRETVDVAVLDLATPGNCDAAIQWFRRDRVRAGIGVVRVSALVRNGGAPRGEFRADVCVPKPFTPRQIVDAVRTVLARHGARQRIATPAAHVIAARASTAAPATLAEPLTLR